jgi:hypothetical protein
MSWIVKAGEGKILTSCAGPNKATSAMSFYQSAG